MNFSIETNRRSATLKVAAIGILILVLLIPVAMVKGVISDRIQFESEAVSDIRRSWGNEQVIAGPILRIPFASVAKHRDGSVYAVEKYAYLVAGNLEGSTDGHVEKRSRGIHDVLVYSSDFTAIATFDLRMLDALQINSAAFSWRDAELLIGMHDLAAMNSAPAAIVDGTEVLFVSTTHQVDGLPSALSAAVGSYLEADTRKLAVNIALSFNGTESLKFLPLAERTDMQISSNWPSPSFSGRRLPTERSVNESGFEATWRTTGLGRALPSVWIGRDAAPNMVDDGAFGVRFITPIGLYQMMDRAVKYAVLFIGLTFITYFLMETVARVRLHPLQYLLVGLANSLFYLLLLSLAEHLGFGVAYVMSAIASAMLIVGYSSTVLGARHRTVVMAGVLAGLYGFLYLTLMAESFALLAGSLGLWCILGAVMYLTRNIDWSSSAEPSESVEPAQPVGPREM